jgi:DNA-binding helix-hairpin-helix protein with protein kinase domain
MAKIWSPDLLKIAAWPTATLSTGNGTVIDGILMPKIAGYREIHHLYSVAQRRKEFPEVDWGFLLHTARNCAIAFEAVHSHGHVVGDVNQKNVMVSKKGIVAFVDCDSFQVAEGLRIFRCRVGVPEYTPPELHGKKFETLDRAANHDLFGLAVLIFHLLMMGRHPFAGVPVAQADIPIEKAIQDGCYAYTRITATARAQAATARTTGDDARSGRARPL